MKLRTKLIPLTSLSLLGTTIVPLTLTGCGANTAIGNAFNLTSYYYPTIERHKSAAMQLTAINKTYVEQLQANIDTFAQDFLWSKSWMGAAFDQFDFWRVIAEKENAANDSIKLNGIPADLFESDREIISNVSMHTQKHLGTLWDQATLSFTYKFDSEVLTSIAESYYMSEKGVTGYVNGHISGEINFFNVPFIITNRQIKFEDSQKDQTVLSFEPDIYFMTAGSEDWKIKFYVASTISGEIVYQTGLVRRIANDYIFNKEADRENVFWPEYSMGFDSLTAMFTSSYYLQRIEVIS